MTNRKIKPRLAAAYDRELERTWGAVTTLNVPKIAKMLAYPDAADVQFTPVLVLALNPKTLAALREQVYNAVNFAMDGEGTYQNSVRAAVDGALRAVGIPKKLIPKKT